MDAKVNNGVAEAAAEPPKESQAKPVHEIHTKKSKEQRKIDDKSVEQVLKALSSLQTPEEKLAAMCKKYTEIVEENRKLGTASKQWEKRSTLAQREKEQLQMEHNKTILLKVKLESLCRELQKQNKAVKDESLLKIREEEEKRKETQAKFQNTLTEITTLMQQNYEKNTKLRDDNIDMEKKFKSVMEQYELREQQVDKMSKQMGLEGQLAEAKLNKANLEAQVEREKLLTEKKQLLMEMAQYQNRCTEMQATEVALRCQVSMYSDKYNEFQNALTKSNEVFGGFKGEMEKMSKKIQKLEKETAMWKQRWEKSHAALLDMAAEKQQRDVSYSQQARQLINLQKLCRTIQAERTSLITALKENNIERPPLPQLPTKHEVAVPEPVDRVEDMAAYCTQLKQSLSQLQGQLDNVLTTKGGSPDETKVPEKSKTPELTTAPKNKSKKGKGKKNKQNENKESSKETEAEKLTVSVDSCTEDISQAPADNELDVLNTIAGEFSDIGETQQDSSSINVDLAEISVACLDDQVTDVSTDKPCNVAADVSVANISALPVTGLSDLPPNIPISPINDKVDDVISLASSSEIVVDVSNDCLNSKAADALISSSDDKVIDGPISSLSDIIDVISTPCSIEEIADIPTDIIDIVSAVCPIEKIDDVLPSCPSDKVDVVPAVCSNKKIETSPTASPNKKGIASPNKKGKKNQNACPINKVPVDKVKISPKDSIVSETEVIPTACPKNQAEITSGVCPESQATCPKDPAEVISAVCSNDQPAAIPTTCPKNQAEITSGVCSESQATCPKEPAEVISAVCSNNQPAAIPESCLKSQAEITSGVCSESQATCPKGPAEVISAVCSNDQPAVIPSTCPENQAEEIQPSCLKDKANVISAMSPEDHQAPLVQAACADNQAEVIPVACPMSQVEVASEMISQDQGDVLVACPKDQAVVVPAVCPKDQDAALAATCLKGQAEVPAACPKAKVGECKKNKKNSAKKPLEPVAKPINVETVKETVVTSEIVCEAALPTESPVVVPVATELDKQEESNIAPSMSIPIVSNGVSPKKSRKHKKGIPSPTAATKSETSSPSKEVSSKNSVTTP